MKVIGYILAFFGGYMALVCVAVPFMALLEGETEDFLMLLLTCVILGLCNAGICWVGIKLAARAKGGSFTPSPTPRKTKPPRAAAVKPTVTPERPSVKEQAAYPSLMTGQLVARFKQTHDQAYHDEYRRRLMFVGFEENEAESLFMLELMILKHDSIEPLASDEYLTSGIFSLQHVALQLDKDYYIEHQMFLVSQIVKIWDEAEWHYWNSHERDLPNDVWAEIYTISRYGGGKLFIEYLQMIAEKSHVPMAKVQQYSMAEQNMIFKYKWNATKGERHPYEGYPR